jgi:hypothetical protein
MDANLSNRKARARKLDTAFEYKIEKGREGSGDVDPTLTNKPTETYYLPNLHMKYFVETLERSQPNFRDS